ncbi:unnamed protein product [Ixodes hexagonus]
MAAANKQFFVYDRRKSNAPAMAISVGQRDNYLELRARVMKQYGISQSETFIICTTNREEINNATYDQLEGGETLYVLKNIDQELTGQTFQKVEYLPHYDTIIKSGMYEYYASEGQNPLPYAFAELIDNSLAATRNNVGSRKIELKLFLDDSSTQMEKSTILVMDNGRGMTSWQLNNWAIYRLSKFIRKDRTLQGSEKDAKSPETFGHKPRFLNSEISYFGAGGKQAIFFIGNSTRMITKPKDSKDVHELVISKEEFEQREKQKDLIYSGKILNRKPGDFSHIPAEEEGIRKVIAEEAGKDQFTCVVIWGVSSEHVQFLKHNFNTWCTQLAHIYHYYLHGPEGNQLCEDSNGRTPSPYRNLEIEVSLVMKSGLHKIANLRDIDTDMETLLIRSASDTFDFKATVDGTRVVEGQLRYHPFLYDHETFPVESSDRKGESAFPFIHLYLGPDGEDEDDVLTTSNLKPARGQRPIFQCFWNGRLIPYTTIDEFEWCGIPKKTRNVPIECFNRISGVLWTDDAFQVSTNKLTFMDLENKLREKSTIFARLLNGQVVRSSIEKPFLEWLQTCHEQSDKQVKFLSYQETVSRKDTQKYKQYPWAVFHVIEWDGKRFKKGQLVRTQRTSPIIIGSIRRFYLYGDHTEAVYATGGEVEILQEPRSMYDEVKILPLAKLDRKVTDNALQKIIDAEEGKLPSKLVVTWPEGDQLTPNEKRPAGKAIGDIKVEIQNQKGETVSKLPGPQSKRLSIEMKIVWHSPSGDQVVAQYVSPHNKNWGYWFRKMGKDLALTSSARIKFLSFCSKILCREGIDLFTFTIVRTEPQGIQNRAATSFSRSPLKILLGDRSAFTFHRAKRMSCLSPHACEPALRGFASPATRGSAVALASLAARSDLPTSCSAFSGHSTQQTRPTPPTRGERRGSWERFAAKLRRSVGALGGPAAIHHFRKRWHPLSNAWFEDYLGRKTRAVLGSRGKKFFVRVWGRKISHSGHKGDFGGTQSRSLHLNGANRTQHRCSRECKRSLDHMVPCFPTKKPSNQGAVDTRDALSPTGAAGDHVVVIRWNGFDALLTQHFIRHLRFEVRDEIGKPVVLTNNVISKLKLNWASNLSKEELLSGTLPDIMCPSSIKQSLFCHIAINTGHVVDFSFTVKPRNGEPSILKVSCKGTTDVRIGEVHQADILISVTDKFQNPIKKLHLKDLAELLIISEGLDYGDVVKALDQSSGFHVTGLKFLDTKLGSKEVCFQWKGLKDYLRLNLVPGPPAALAYVDYNPSEPVTMSPDGKLPKPLVVQLQDARGNPTNEPNVKVHLGVDEGMKVIPPQQPVKTDSKGRASFGILTFATKLRVIPKPCEFNICSTNCRGRFTLGTKATIGRSFITGPVLRLHLTCDPEKPVELNVDFKGKKTFTVAEELPEIAVHVLAEDGNIMCSLRGKELSMKLMRIDCSPKNQKMFTASPAESTSSGGIYHFRKVKVPEAAGEYNLQFHFNNGKHMISSSVISLTVQPDCPVKIAPQQDPSIPSVSNQAKTSSRNLLKYLKLDLTDRFGNNTAVGLTGTLTLQIVSPDPGVTEIPRFEGNVNSYQVPISKGCAVVQNLQIQENTEGVDGFQYILRFTPSLPKSQVKTALPHYEVPFLFYNDASKQEEMAKLTKKRTELLKQLQTFEDLFQTTENIYTELEAVIRDAQTEESKFRGELRRIGFNSNSIREEQHVAPAVKSCEAQRQALDNKNKRTYMSAAYPEEPDVLGKIGHLAWVEEDDVAAVLSWHMRGDIDCVVTNTMEKAKDVYRKTNGKQQVVAVDSINRRNLSKLLPHMRNKSFTPTGNPKFALDYFMFRKDPETCRTVFANFIGDTIVLDTLDDATKYRTEVTKFSACPTLLAKTGERIASTGKFGGAQNRAPSLAQLQGNVFGEPPVKDVDRIQEQIQLLKKLAVSMKKQKEAKTELDKQKQKDTTFTLKKKDYEALKKELAGVEDAISRMSAYSQEDERCSLSLPIPDLVRNSPRRPGASTPIAKYPASPRTTPNDAGVNGVSRRGRSTPAPPTPPSERKRRRVT